MVVAAILAITSTSAFALFGRYMPLNLSGSVGYSYNYLSAGDAEAETTTLTGTLNAMGYIWQPWFASTSAALNIGVSNTETTTSSSDSNYTSGSIGFSVFPRSRFPFSLNYSLSDSRAERYQNIGQASGGSHHKISRLTIRQLYEGRATKRSIGSRTNLWYSTTHYDSDTTDSDSEAMGVEYKIRLVPHNFSISANRSTSKSSDSPLEPLSDVVDLTHTYIPDPDLGVTNIVTYVKTEDGIGSNESALSQLSSNFYWRPEHRAINIQGGVRISETESQTAVEESKTKSMNTSLGASYRLTRRLSLGAGLGVGSSDSGTAQTLTTTQSGRLTYTSSQIQLAEYHYNWQGGINASNSSVRVDTGTTETSTDIQIYGSQLSHSLSRTWVPGKGSSIGMNLGQSGSVTSSSEDDIINKGINHSAGLSWNRRGRSGSIYGNLRVSDSRVVGRQDSEFQNLDASLSQDWIINRLSNIQGTLSYTESRQKTQSETADSFTSDRNRRTSVNIFYRHDRPMGIYNSNFTSRLLGNREIDRVGLTTWDWDNRFQYRLGLLDTSLSFRIIDNSGGEPTKSLYFQATRSF